MSCCLASCFQSSTIILWRDGLWVFFFLDWYFSRTHNGGGVFFNLLRCHLFAGISAIVFWHRHVSAGLLDVQAERAKTVAATPNNADLIGFIIADVFSYSYIVSFYECKITTYYFTSKIIPLFFDRKVYILHFRGLFLTFINN